MKHGLHQIPHGREVILNLTPFQYHAAGPFTRFRSALYILVSSRDQWQSSYAIDDPSVVHFHWSRTIYCYCTLHYRLDGIVSTALARCRHKNSRTDICIFIARACSRATKSKHLSNHRSKPGFPTWAANRVKPGAWIKGCITFGRPRGWGSLFYAGFVPEWTSSAVLGMLRIAQGDTNLEVSACKTRRRGIGATNQTCTSTKKRRKTLHRAAHNINLSAKGCFLA